MASFEEISAKEKLKIAKLKILNSSRAMRFFACLGYKFETIILEPQGVTSFVTFNTNLKKFEIYFDSEFVDNKTSQELVYVMLHEMTHVLNNHLSRGLNHDHEIYNIACDHVINDRLDQDIENGSLTNIKSPKDKTLINKFIKENVTAEEIYDYLMNDPEVKREKVTKKIKITSFGSGTGKSEKGEPGEEKTGEEGETGEGEGEGEGDTLEITETKLTMPDGQEIYHKTDVILNCKNKEKLDEETNNVVSEARCILNSPLMKNDKSKGNGSSGLLELIKNILEIKLPWTELVEHAIKSTVVISNDNKSWKNLNKRLNAHGIHSPGFGTEEKINTLIMCNDTSGSMTKDDLRKFVSVIKNSAYYFSKVIKIDHDYKITNYKELSDDEILMENIEIFTFKGRGGTSHRDVFDKLEELYEENDDDISLILFLTDFESDIESLWSRYKWTKEIPAKFICTSKHHSIPESIDKNPIYI